MHKHYNFQEVIFHYLQAFSINYKKHLRNEKTKQFIFSYPHCSEFICMKYLREKETRPAEFAHLTVELPADQTPHPSGWPMSSKLEPEFRWQETTCAHQLSGPTVKSSLVQHSRVIKGCKHTFLKRSLLYL